MVKLKSTYVCVLYTVYLDLFFSLFHWDKRLQWEFSHSWSPIFLISCCSFLSSCHPPFFSLPLIWTPFSCISWHSHPQLLSVAVVMEVRQTSRGISWQNSGVQGLGVTMGVRSLWEFSLYQLQWRQNLLGKAINRFLFMFLSVGWRSALAS